MSIELTASEKIARIRSELSYGSGCWVSIWPREMAWLHLLKQLPIVDLMEGEN